MRKLESQKSLQNSNLNKFGLFYEKTFGKLVPRYAILSLIFCILLQIFAFFLTRLIINLYMPIADRFFMETHLDHKIPLLQSFVTIYFLAYALWVINFILATRTTKEHWSKCAFSYILGLVVTIIIFLAVPSTMNRPEITGNGFFDGWMKLLYFLDEPTNLFPSLHCFTSMISFLWISKIKNIHISYKAFALIFAILVFASTLFVKQHCIVDVFLGIALAFLCYWVSKLIKNFNFFIRIFDRLDALLFIKKEKN